MVSLPWLCGDEARSLGAASYTGLGVSSNERCGKSHHPPGLQSCESQVSGPPQTLDDRPPHDPVLVLFRQEREFLGEMRHALAVARLGVRIGHVGPPMAAARAEGLKQRFDMWDHVAERIRLFR